MLFVDSFFLSSPHSSESKVNTKLVIGTVIAEDLSLQGVVFHEILGRRLQVLDDYQTGAAILLADRRWSSTIPKFCLETPSRVVKTEISVV
tara:strand:+ start:1051 stop:1323 length:273 start_codon:yes stop_codon:yes gene_type:complete